MISPAIILVETQLPENIGAAARAMMNFGLNDLRLVAPREAFPNKRAYDLAGHAAGIIDGAKVFPDTKTAIADLQKVYAATARSREIVKAVFTSTEAAENIFKENVPIGILFGPERTGLTNEDVTLADAIITIPTSSENSSLNIAQSVVVVAYEWFKNSILKEVAADAPLPSDRMNLNNRSPFASKKELQVFFDHLEKKLDEVDFWKVDEKKGKMWLNLQNIFTRANLTEQEVRTLHGVIAELGK